MFLFFALIEALPCCSKCPYDYKAHRDQRKIQSILPNRCQKCFPVKKREFFFWKIKTIQIKSPCKQCDH